MKFGIPLQSLDLINSWNCLKLLKQKIDDHAPHYTHKWFPPLSTAQHHLPPLLSARPVSPQPDNPDAPLPLSSPLAFLLDTPKRYFCSVEASMQQNIMLTAC